MTKIRNPSLPKAKIKILLLEGISDTAVSAFEANGYAEIVRLKTALDGAALVDALRDARILGIRSRTQLTREVIDATDRLIAIGCFSVGTNQVDLAAANARGIPVFNAPFSNTRSVAELTIAEIIMLFRSVFPKSVAAHGRIWQKDANGAREIRGKTLGIVGYGNIGSQLAVLAEAMGMRVIYFDTSDKLRHGNVEPVETLAELLSRADAVSLHVPESRATHTMIGETQLALMKPGAFLINNARGSVIDIDALAAALKSGHLGGAAIDVFPSEPSSNKDPFMSPLQSIPNVILTPHIGGSTEEAQENIGAEVARKLVEYSDIGATQGAVNFPQVQLPPRPNGTRFIQMHHNVPGELRRLNEVFARHNVNIATQFLQTDSKIGYVVLDADGTVENAADVLEDIRDLPGTIRARILNPF